MDEPPRMRTAKPPSGVRLTSTPGKRPMSTCSTDCPGALAMSSAVTVALGGELEAGGGAADAHLFRWTQAGLRPPRKPRGHNARVQHEGLWPRPRDPPVRYVSAHRSPD